ELEDLMAGRWRWRRRRTRAARGISGASATAAAPTAAGARAVGDPDVAIAINVNAVRRRDHPRAEALHEIPILVELEHRVERRANTAVRAASLGDPDA